MVETADICTKLAGTAAVPTEGPQSMDSIGLYYPYMHFRSESWLKAAALYWPQMGRMVPRGYPTRDSVEVQILRGEVDFIVDIDPTPATFAVSEIFQALLASHGEQLRRHLLLAPDTASVTHTQADPTGVGFVYAPKIAPALRAALEDMGLTASRGAYAWQELARPSMTSPGDWVGMDARLAGVYMCVLAQHLAKGNDLHLTTDQAEAQVAVSGLTVDDVARVLLGDALVAHDLERSRSNSELETRLALLALKAVIPANLAEVPMASVVKLRQDHYAEFQAFRDQVQLALKDLADLDDLVSPEVQSAHLRAVVRRRFEEPRAELKRAFKSSGLATADASVVATTTVATALLAGPWAAAVPGAAFGVYSMARDLVRHRRAAQSVSPAGAYMLRVSRLSSERAIARGLDLASRLGP
jgi:hypothetical protein